MIVTTNLGRWSRFLEKYFNLKGSGAISDIDSTVSANISLEPAVDTRYIQSWQRFAVALPPPAVAALNSAAQLRNPAGSNVIAVVERLGMMLGIPGTNVVTYSRVNWGGNANPSDLGSAATPNPLDPRQQAGATCIATFGTGGAAAAFGEIGCFNGLESNVIFDVEQEIPIPPGWGIRVIDRTVNEAMTVNIVWRERALEQSELN